MSKVPTKGPDAREREATHFCEKNEPLVKEAGEITRQRIFTRGATLTTPLSHDVKLASDRAVAAANRLTEAIENAKTPPKEVSAREATYQKELRIFKRREAAFKRLQKLLDETKVVMVESSKVADVKGSDLAWEPVQQIHPAEKRSFLRRLFSR